MARSRRADRAASELAFLVDGQSYSVPADRVIEILRTPPITRVPLAPAGIAGVINFHGAPIPVLRLGALLTSAPDQPMKLPPRVVVYADPEPLGLLVDAVVKLSDSSGRTRGTRRLDVAELVQDRLGDTGADGPVNRSVIAARSETRSSLVDAGRALLSFLVAGQHYALPLDSVREVMALPDEVSSRPNSDASLVGLVNLRDAVVPLVSLAGLLGLRGAGQGDLEKQHVVVAAIGSWVVGLVTGAMDKVLHLPETSIEPVPDLLQRSAGVAELEAIGRLDGGRELVSILSPAKLFGNKIVADAVARLDQGDGGVTTTLVEAATEQFVVLLLGNERYGLPIASVDEIVQLPDEVTRLPKAPAFLAGVINLRGAPLPVIDQRQRFDARSAETAGRPRVVIVTVDGLQAGFIVDGVSEIVRVPTDAVRAAPRLPGDQARAFDRVAPLGTDGEMLLLIDPRELLNRAERDLLSHLEAAKSSAGS